MKKTVKLLSLLTLSCVLLSGCGGSKESSGDSTGQSSSAAGNTSAVENTSGAESATGESQPGSDSEAVSSTESTADAGSAENSDKVQSMPLDLDGTELDPDSESCTSDSGSNHTYYIFDGFAWFAEPTGQAYVTVDGTIPQPVDYAKPEFKRLKAGDEMNGLKILNAETEIDVIDGESFFNGCKAEFEGTTEITGYAFIQNQDEYMMPEDTIFFLPEEGGCDFPLIYTNCHTLGDPIVYDGICWGNEYDRWFDLGNINDYADKEWLSLLPSNGTPVRVTATVSNVSMSYYNDSHKSGNGWLSCTIDDLKLAE